MDIPQHKRACPCEYCAALREQQQLIEDLLAACESALARLIQLGAEDESDKLGKCPACEMLRAAIAKARGQ